MNIPSILFIFIVLQFAAVYSDFVLFVFLAYENSALSFETLVEIWKKHVFEIVSLAFLMCSLLMVIFIAV